MTPPSTTSATTRAPTVLSVVGARPQFVKAAMVSRAIAALGIQEILVHTGQHYDENMSGIFFSELELLSPAFNLDVGSESHAKQTALILERLDDILVQENPDAVIIYGDTNSTLAAAIAASKRAIPVIHVEAGMRSYDKYQPEEINRVTADHVSALLLCAMPSAVDNLAKEGITQGVVHIGDVMYDALLRVHAAHPAHPILDSLALARGQYILATVHRPESTDNPEHLRAIVAALTKQTERVVFPLHPRTRAALLAHRLLDSLQECAHITLLEPQPYSTIVSLAANARVVFTESGGLQKEAYFLQVPCVNPRDRTEWHELVTSGWQTIAAYDEALMVAQLRDASPQATVVDGFGDGHAAEHAGAAIAAFLKQSARNQ